MPEANLDVISGRKKRRLPPWICVSAPEELSQTKGIPLSGKEEIDLELETRKRSRKKQSIGIDKDPHGSCLDSKQTSSQRKEPRNNGGGKRGKKRIFSRQAEKKTNEAVDASDREMDLTVEDLTSIAREYVNADAERRQTTAATTLSTTVDGSQTKFSRLHSAVSMKGSIDTCSGSTGFISGSSERTLLHCSSRLSQAEPNEEHDEPVSTKKTLDVCTSGSSEREEEHEEKVISTLETSRTGDVAHDMLNLFLGPLLQKSEPSQPKSVGIFPCEPIKHSSKEMASEKKVEGPTEKKKSSLRDKVSLFLS